MSFSDYIQNSTELIDNYKQINQEGKAFKDLEIGRLVKLLENMKKTKEDLESLIKTVLEVMRKKVKLTIM